MFSKIAPLAEHVNPGKWIPVDFTKPNWKAYVPTNEKGITNSEVQLFANCILYAPATKQMHIKAPGLSLQAQADSVNTGMCSVRDYVVTLVITGQRFSGTFNNTARVHLQDEVHIQFCSGPEGADEVWWVATVFVNGDRTAKQTYCNET